MRKVTVTVALFIAVLSALATPLAAQTDWPIRFDTDDALSGPHGRARRHRRVRFAALAASSTDHGRPYRSTASRRDGPPVSGAAASS